MRSHHLLEHDLARLLASPPADAPPEVLAHLRSIADAGEWVMVELGIAEMPTDLRWLFESGAVTLEQLAAIHNGLGVISSADLIAEVRLGSVGRVSGLDPSIEAAIATVLPNLRANVPRTPLGRAVATVEPILNRLSAMPDVVWARPVGSLRRGQDLVGDVEVLAPATHPERVLTEIAAMPKIDRIRHRSDRRVYFVIDRIQVGVRCPAPEAAGAALVQLTGSPSHVDQLFHLARGRDLSFQSDGLRSTIDRHLVASTEEEIYSALDLAFIPPELRNGDDEIDLARRGQLPTLVSRAHIRGDLHMHSSWSDGRDSIEAMVQGCIALGYQYMAITDHSPHSSASRNLTFDDVARQADEIAALAERYPQIAILHGCEVDILPNGRLDFTDRLLRAFDIVLASLHDRAGQSPEELLRRYLGAMTHPLVSIVTHPMNRMVPQRSGYDLNVDRLFEAAVETRTVLEIDGAPSHLDLESSLARRAVEVGVMVVIDSDAHRAEMLERYMALGLLTARRGRVEPRHVLNARSLPEVRAVIAAKRRR